MFNGTYTALVTPFRRPSSVAGQLRRTGGQIDEAALQRLIKMQIQARVDGIGPVGTTGKPPACRPG
jgi:dihydrodipicolinate synthase/N-acetylneuraminate lyase